ncbi:CoA transferase [Microbacterium barkeri]
MERTALDELLTLRGRGNIAAPEVMITGSDPVFSTPYRAGEVTAQVLAACGVAANDLWQLRTGRRQRVTVDTRAAAATLMGSELTRRRDRDGVYRPIPGSPSMTHMVALTQPWSTADGRWFLPHTNLPHLERRVLDVLDCESTPDSVAAAIGRRRGQELEDAIAAANACGGLVRTAEEWLAHPQGEYLAARPVVEITKIADSAPEPLPDGDLPLSGIRVLDLTRILAGPTCGLTLAEFGADDLMVTAPHLPQVVEFVRDTSPGKRSTFLDITHPHEAATLADLTSQADVFLEGYRPGRLAARGFGTDDLTRLRPGIIHVTVNCFGSGGPFGERAGWDQVAQAVTGMCIDQAEATGANGPKLTPVYMCDFVAGRLAAFGTMIALARRAVEGGSYRVQVSLAQAAMFFQRHGLTTPSTANAVLTLDSLEEYVVRQDATVYGDLELLGPVLRLSETTPRWEASTPALGSSTPRWLAR